MEVPGLVQQVLTPGEAARVRSALEALQSHWTVRSSKHELYTLGNASYLDATTVDSRNQYYEKSGPTNQLLRERLGWLYERLQERLEAALDAPVRYREECSLPGFHIFLGGPQEHYTPSIHVDRQFQNIRWRYDDYADFSRTISFTLAIELPTSGAGLNTWEEEDGEPFDAVQRFFRTYDQRTPDFHAYTPGAMVIHSGNLVHQIAMGERSRGNHRITLQGHALWSRAAWQLYW